MAVAIVRKSENCEAANFAMTKVGLLAAFCIDMGEFVWCFLDVDAGG